MLKFQTIHFKLSAVPCSTDVIKKEKISCVHYDKVVESVMYLMVCTKFDIVIALGKVNK